MNPTPEPLVRRARTRVMSALLATCLCIAGLALAIVQAEPALANTTLDNSVSFSGHAVLSSVPFDRTSALGVHATGNLDTTLDWTQAAKITTDFDPNLLRQGRNLDPSDTYAPDGAGSMTATWSITDLVVNWGALGPFNIGTVGFSATGACTMSASGSDHVCHLESDSAEVLPPAPWPVGGPFIDVK